jgi:hypothetical protein
MLVGAGRGEPVEFYLEPGSANDNPPFKGFDLDLREGSIVYADKQCNDYHYEDLLLEAASIEMRPLRERNSKRPFEACVEYIRKRRRKRVETAFSQIVGFFPRSIHAVRARGFELKIVCFILAFAIQFL